MNPVVSDRSWAFDVPATRVWASLGDTDRFATWWPWLRGFEAPEGLRAGAEWRCAVKPPLPYAVRFTLTIDEVSAPVLVAASVRGDVAGRARLDLTSDGSGGCTLRLRSTLCAARPRLAALGLIASPLTRWGHDWILDTGVRQFARDVGAARGSSGRRGIAW